MRTVHRLVAFLLPALLLMTRAPIAVAQSQNEQARKWFTRSQRENAPSRQIEALQQAIAQDSLFLEAYDQLGQIYIRQQNDAAAELYLARAAALVTAPEENQRKAQLLFALAGVRQRLDKLHEAEAALRAAKTLAHTRQMQAAILLELGTILYRQQRYPEAFAEFLSQLETDSLNRLSARQAENGFHVLYGRAQRYSAKGNVEKAVVVYDSLLQRLGALEVAARLAGAAADSNVAWPLSATLPSRQSKRSSLYPLGVTVTIVLVPLFGLMFLAPTARANFYLWRRNYPAAARTLEKLLERHPKRAGLYGPLAELYLQLGRNDERALRVYQTVLRLNLPTRRRDEINTLLAQKYLAEGRTDSEVIEVLENALKVESRNQNRSVKALPAKPRFVL